MALRTTFLLLSAVVGLVAGSDTGTDMGANPIRKIVTLLQDMQKEIEVEGEKEQKLFDKFMCFCDGGAAELSKTSADAAAQVESLTSQVEEETSRKAGLEQDLVKHKADRESAVADLDKATTLRGKENSDNEADLGDQQANFNAISGAIPALEKGMSGASLLQGDGLRDRLKRAVEASQAVSAGEKQDVTAFLEAKDDSSSPASGEIVGILKAMKDEMQSSIKDLQTSEEEAARGFAQLKSAKDQEIEIASEAIEVKTKQVGELAVSIVQAQDGADDAATQKADADKTLATLDTQCAEKKKEHDARSKTRAEEVTAISETITILNDDDALDVFKAAVPSALFLQEATHPAHKTGFLQVNNNMPLKLRKAQGIVAAMLEKSPSHGLSFLSYKMKAQLNVAKRGAVDFGEITKLIDDMTKVLSAEQADDEKHKTWCQGELASAADEEASVTNKANALTADIAEATDEVASLADDLAQLEAKIAALDKDTAVSTEQRKEEHQEYLETVSLTEAAIELMGKAKNRLQKFYNPALYKEAPKKELSSEDAIVRNLGGASSLVEVRAVRHGKSRVMSLDFPEVETGLYQKKTEKSGGVMALMDMLTGELRSSLQEAQLDEKAGAADYVKFMGDAQATRASDAKSLVDKSAAKANLEGKLVELKETKYTTMKQLENTHAYMGELHSSCDFILANFALRQEARTSEIEGLKNAKAVLAGASYA